MSEALYNLGGLRFWSQDEIELRELFQTRVISVVKSTLLDLNPAWSFIRTEGPCLSPREQINSEYTQEDIFETNHKDLCLRAETTASSYVVARSSTYKLPLCVYQSGKSFRRELNQGARASKLRFNEFWQLEFQCIYASSTKQNYRPSLITQVREEIGRFTRVDTRSVLSERTPKYSESTVDIEARYKGHWIEMASCSIRTDYSSDTRVCEIAIGLDRVATLSCIATGPTTMENNHVDPTLLPTVK